MKSFNLAQALLIVGRLLLGGLFVFAGVRHMFLIPVLTQAIAARGVPFPRLVLLAGSSFQFVGGVLLIVGLWMPAAAFGLIVFTIAASVMLLNFWDMDGPARQNIINVWLSNMAIVGGLLVTAAQAL
ncbi:DoxX family protein [Bradyrhizobium sp. G127]|uniref:DoxX family protein n=1 Tax=Bradyrhizobium sp. G127 TaxID=2904800 RepID=UPI0024C0AA17|nr:DoxX family protein [Bradyrhizobium sp. G127]